MPDDYDPSANAYRCWQLAIREIRLQGIRDGKFTPRPDDAEEMAAAAQTKGGIR